MSQCALREALEKAIKNERRLYDECRGRLWGMDREHYYCMDVLRDILRAAPLIPTRETPTPESKP